MPMLRSMRLLNSIEAGTTNAAALQTLLADAGRLSEWSALLSSRALSRRLLSSSVALDAVLGSARALGAVLANPVSSAALYSPDLQAALAPSAWGVYAPRLDAFDLSGTAVTRWRNALGQTGRDMLQATGGSRPLLNYVDSPLANVPTLAFDGTDDFLQAGEAFNQATAYTVFVVYRRGNTADCGLFGDTGGALGASGASSAITSAGGAAVTFSTAAGGSGAWAISRFRRLSAAALYHSLNGGSDSTAVATQIPSFNTSGAQIGAASNQGAARYLNGRIAEVWLLAGNGDAASPEVQRVTTLLKTKYNL